MTKQISARNKWFSRKSKSKATRRKTWRPLLEQLEDRRMLAHVGLLVEDSLIDENGGSTTVRAIRTDFSTSGAAIEVGLTFAGTAVKDTDYTASALSLTIPNGQFVSDPITIAGSDDALVEGNENFQIVIASLTSGNTGIGNSATGSIVDDEGATVFSVTSNLPEFFEGPSVGGAPDEITPAAFTITRIGDTSGSDVINFTIAGTATNGTDYNNIGGTSGASGTTGAISFAPGETTKTITMDVIGDNDIEGNETITLSLTAGTFIGDNPAVFTIKDDDGVKVEFDHAADGDTEPDGSNIPMLLVSGTLAAPATVDVTVQTSSTATAGDDFTLTTTVVIPAGSYDGTAATALPVPLAIVNDTEVEGEEVIDLLLANPVGAVIIGDANNDLTSQDAHSYTITDNDTAVLKFALIESTTSEGAGTHNVGVVLVVTGNDVEGNGTIGANVQVDVDDLLSGTATPGGTDYTFADPTTVTFLADSASGTTVNATLTITDDSLAEPDETADLQLTGLSDPTGGQISIDNSMEDHTVTITDAIDRSKVTVFFAAANSTTPEPTDKDVLVELDLDGVTLAANLTVTVGDAGGGTATSDEDYTAVGAPTVTFTTAAVDGATMPVTIDVLEDTLAENDETVNLQITDVAGPGGTGTQTTHELTITDQDDRDKVTVFFVDADSTTPEPTDKDVAVEIALNGVTLGADLVVTISDAGGGTATSGDDYTAVASILTFTSAAADGDTMPATIDVLDDTLAENDETLNLSISNVAGPGGTGAQTTHELTITDQDDRDKVTVFFSAADSTTPEPTDKDVAVEIDLDGVTLATDLTVTVEDAGGGTATSGDDYTAVGTAMVTFTSTATDGDTMPVTIDVLDDLLAENDETLNLSISNVAGPGSAGAQSTHELTITDTADVSNVSVEFVAADSNVGEADVDHNVTIQLNLGGGITLASDLTVSVTDAGTGDATDGDDYDTFGTQMATFATTDGDGTVKNVVLTINEDAIAENNETVNLQISTVDGPSTVGTQSAHQVTIIDDDISQVTVTVSPACVNEDGSHELVYTFFRTNASNESPALTVGFGVTGTAGFGTDYTQSGAATFNATSGSVTFAAGSTVAIVNIDPNADGTIEPTETVVLTVTAGGGGYNIGTANTATGEIKNDDTATVSIFASDPDAGEPNDDGEFTIEMTNPSVSNTTISLSVGTETDAATPGSDYVTLPTSVMIPAGQTTVTVPVEVMLDATAGEPAETVTAILGTITAGDMANITVAPSPNNEAVVTISEFASASIDDEGDGVPEAGYVLNDPLYGLPSTTHAGFKGDITPFWDNGAGGGHATYTFNVVPGNYIVSATWRHIVANAATTVTYDIYDGAVDGTPDALDTVNHRVAPVADVVEGGSDFENLAMVTVTGGTLTVQLTDRGAFGWVVADSVRVELLSPLHVESEATIPAPISTSITDADVGEVVQQSIAAWSEIEPGAADILSGVRVNVMDLSGSLLGLASQDSGTIWLDANAAGHGWDVDSQQSLHRHGASFELSSHEQPAGAQLSLFRVVSHELGHLLGHRDLYGDEHAGELMAAVLPLHYQRGTTQDAHTPVTGLANEPGFADVLFSKLAGANGDSLLSSPLSRIEVSTEHDSADSLFGESSLDDDSSLINAFSSERMRSEDEEESLHAVFAEFDAELDEMESVAK